MSDSNKQLHGNIIALVGAVILSLGLFLPWVTLGKLAVDAFIKTPDHAYLLLALAGLSVLLSIWGILKKSDFGLVYILIALIIGVLQYLVYYRLTEHLESNKVFGRVGQIGPGFWVTCAGAFFLLIAALSMVQLKRKK